MEICHKNMTFASQFSRSLDGTSTDQSATYDFLLVIQVTTGLPPTCTEINGDFSWYHKFFPPPVYLTPLLRVQKHFWHAGIPSH